MAIWLELHCDVQSYDADKKKLHLMACETTRGNILGELTLNNAESVAKTRRALESQALKRGYERRKSRTTGRVEWICPACQRREANQTEDG